MVVTDVALGEIIDHIAVHRPERGGALYGPRNYPLVTHFDLDSDAVTTSVSYVPSLRLIERVQRVERETGLKFKGIIHSHPDGMIRPSSGDRDSATNLFHHNSHLSSFAMPIVQQVREGSSHRSKAFIHWYTVERRAAGQSHGTRGPTSRTQRDGNLAVEILDEEFHVLPIREHCEVLLAHLRKQGIDLKLHGGLQPLQIEHAQLVGLVARSSEGREIMFFVSFDYPVVAPIVLFGSDGKTKSLKHRWDGLSDVQESLERVAELLAGEWGGGSSRGPDAEEAQLPRWMSWLWEG